MSTDKPIRVDKFYKGYRACFVHRPVGFKMFLAANPQGGHEHPVICSTSTLKANEMHLSVVQMSAVKRLEHRTACAGALALVGLYIHLQVEQPVYVHDPGKGTTRESCRDPVHRTVSR